jgi:Tfp pilus assembly pilus retraction ATPase PilT
MEILNNQYASANLIRTGKIEQLYSQMQTRTRDKPGEKMITMESHLARLVKADKLDIMEARKWANNLPSFMDAMKT